MARELRASRYLTAENQWLAEFITNELRYLDFDATCDWYAEVWPKLDNNGMALLGANDRYFLLTGLLDRSDLLHPWLFDRCREVEARPDGYLDLWARAHYKSTILTFAGNIQDIICDPEIKIAIFSVVKSIAQEFLAQIKEEFESNERLKSVYHDVLWANPKGKTGQGRPPKWGVARGIVVRRRGNPKEATVEAHGLLDGQPTSRHFDKHVYDDVVTQDHLTEGEIKKTTERFEMADNLGTALGVRKQAVGSRYHYADSYQVMIDRKSLKPRIYPATDDGTATGNPVLLTRERLAEIRNTQRSTFSAQMLLNPLAGTDATFQPQWMRPYEVIPSVLNVYIMVDPSKGRTRTSDRTAIAVIGLDVNGNKYLLDGYCHRMKLSDRWRYVRELELKWRNHHGVQIVAVGYEQYGMQSDLEVIEEYQERDKTAINITELNTPQQGGHSKDDRIERLEPDLRESRFLLPAAAWHPDLGGQGEYLNVAFWTVWTDTDQKAFEAKMAAAGTPRKPCPYNVGQVLFRPVQGLTRSQRYCEATGQASRIVKAIRRRDENKDIYDVTRVFMEEMRLHPFAAHDDFIDACSRIYDMKPFPPTQLEAGATDSVMEDNVQGQLDA